MESKFYWLKLKRDFFKRHDIRVVEAMPNGKDYILFYLKLLLESIDHEGRLRFSETIPYSAEMLSVVTNTNVDVVKSAIKVFSELGMMELFDDGTLFMTEVEAMIGSQSATPNAIRMRRHYEKQKSISGAFQNEMPAILNQNESKRIEKDIEIEKEKDKKKFVPPTLEDVRQYIYEKGLHVDAEQFFNYFTVGDWTDAKGQKVKNWKQKLLTWEKYNVKDAPRRSTMNNFSSESETDYDALTDKAAEDFFQKYGG